MSNANSILKKAIFRNKDVAYLAFMINVKGSIALFQLLHQLYENGEEIQLLTDNPAHKRLRWSASLSTWPVSASSYGPSSMLFSP
jgi:hypothetical protein